MLPEARQRRKEKSRISRSVRRPVQTRYARNVRRRLRLDALLWTLLLIPLAGCEGEIAAFLALAGGSAFGAWLVGRDRRNRALYEAESLRHAIATGQHRQIEEGLRKQLALAAAGEAVSPERQWLARAQLGGLLVAEWRLDEARGIYGDANSALSPDLAALSAFGRHELAVLTEKPDDDRLASIRGDRDEFLAFVPAGHRNKLAAAWNAVEGLCLVRMGRAREAIPLIERGLEVLDYYPARVVYLFHLGQAYDEGGDQKLAGETYDLAAKAFPGTRLASEAQARGRAIGAGGGDALFRGMLPEAPGGSGFSSADGEESSD
jgi:tetratricopeptide (TPR) repeat protein